MKNFMDRYKIALSTDLLTIKIGIPGCSSLKDKRSHIQPLLSRLHKEFNFSLAEIGLQDIWQSAVIGAVIISNDANYNHRVLNKSIETIEKLFPDIEIEEFHIEGL